MDIRALLDECRSMVMAMMPQIMERRYRIQYKPDQSPVTEADQYIEAKLHAFLQARLPGLTFVGEESYDFQAAEQPGYFVLLDPIDGTENFCSGLKEWGVSLGVWKDGIHQGSLLMMPELGEHIMTGDPCTKLHSRITGFSSSFNEEIADGIRDAIEYRVTGCAVYNLFNVIRGSFARFINPKGAYAWDLLPGVMLALEHGCSVRVNDADYLGQFLEPHRKYRVDIRHRYDPHPG
jgi:myo-inositol-1(or 4)-monophosphatase